MDSQRFVYYEDEGVFVGWLEEYPDYRTQGATLDELKEHLRELFKDVCSGEIPCIRKVGELKI